MKMMDLLSSPNLLIFGTLLKTENINTSFMLILIIIYSLFNYLFESVDKQTVREYFDKKIKYFIDYLINHDTVSIQLTTHHVSSSVGYSDKIQKKKIYSTDFVALLDYIKDINISKKKEILTTQLKELSYANRWKENDNEDNRYQFIPLNDFYEETLISKDHNIYLKMRNIERIDDDKKNNDTCNELTATIFCYYDNNNDKIKKINILKDFLNHIRKIYLDKIAKKDNNQYVFEYEKSETIDNETKLYFSEHINEHNKNFNNVIIENKQKLIDYVTKFKKESSQDVLKQYERMGIPYKAGMLFWGSPGTGKTSTIKAILKETNRHGIIIDLSNIETNKELESIFRTRIINDKKYKGNELCYIIEDCDATKLSSIKERKEDPKITVCNNENNKLSSEIKNIIIQPKSFDLSCFLNILDGIIELHGVMIIISTNHPDKIDEALIRPGRIDFKYEFKKITKNNILDLVSLKYDLSDTNITEIKELIKDMHDYVISPAQVQCILFNNNCDAIDCVKIILHEINKILFFSELKNKFELSDTKNLIYENKLNKIDFNDINNNSFKEILSTCENIDDVFSKLL